MRGKWFGFLNTSGHLLAPKVVVTGAAILVALSAITIALAASTIVSNVLRLGPSNLVLESVALTSVDNFPASMKVGEKRVARFRIANQGSQLSNATLKVRLGVSGTSLSSPSSANITFKDPDTGNRQAVSLTIVDGALEGALKSAWAMPSNYTGDAEVELTFNGTAPLNSYYVDLWVENDSAGSGATPTPSGGAQTVSVQAANGDVFNPASVTIKVGDTVRWTNADTKPHNVVFSNASIPSTTFLAVGQTHQATFSTAGTYGYVCQFHSGMAGTVVVQP